MASSKSIQSGNARLCKAFCIKAARQNAGAEGRPCRVAIPYPPRRGTYLVALIDATFEGSMMPSVPNAARTVSAT
jgi:hypothetical protein